MRNLTEFPVNQKEKDHFILDTLKSDSIGSINFAVFSEILTEYAKYALSPTVSDEYLKETASKFLDLKQREASERM